jgi:hypothetical protein
MLYKGTKILETNISFPFTLPSNPTIDKKTMLCQSIQKLVHPRGIYWDNEKKCYLTIEENKVFGLFRSISSDYEAATKEKQDKSCDLSCLVAGRGLEPLTSGL